MKLSGCTCRFEYQSNKTLPHHRVDGAAESTPGDVVVLGDAGAVHAQSNTAPSTTVIIRRVMAGSFHTMR